MASASATGKLSREEFRRQKDLDAARKAGTAPAAVDEEGKVINPHIPQYIAQAPWYLDTGAPSLSHQRIPEYDRSADKLDNWYDRGAKAGPAAKKYRKGACENCGAVTHKKVDCLERPRKRGARFTGKDIAPDEIIQDVASGYDAKRDRWNGYDPSEHRKVYDEYAAVEAARQKIREEEIDKQTTTDLAAVRKVAKAGKGEEKKDDDFGSSDEEDEDTDKYAEAADAVGQKLDTKTRITVRNLRIREDTAKYLINLDPESAYYDPKTRSMRDNPLRDVPEEEALFAGENFLRYSGEAPDVQQLQLFAWNAAARGNDVHMNANPTQGQLLHQEYQKKKEQLRDSTKVSILAKYGGEQYLEKAPKELLQGQTEEYVEFSRAGQVVKGKERAKARSKYLEDAGIEAAKASSAQNLLASSSKDEPSEAPKPDLGGSDDRQKKAEELFSKRRLGEGEVKIDESKLTQALRAERERKRKGRDEEEEWGGKKKKAGDSHEVTEEELEAYRMNRRMTEDPMANYVDEEL
ncbi:hypothetical protein PHLCEN_2v3233 [Hermanssonia centrifuga]|uniref:Pre-mRNA-splicing factor SLU7 n=1 Tax=Hermanssonia centrifuga TaxID=98765 RepID=A0A2R6QXL1_9APHY|nr:hypothetical protein PHLCEN_2v3233 [Hermanssonia centrifuga]